MKRIPTMRFVHLIVLVLFACLAMLPIRGIQAQSDTISCGNGEGEPVSLFVPDYNRPAAESVLCSFAEQNAIALTINVFPQGEYTQDLTAFVGSGQAPTLAYVPNLPLLNDLYTTGNLIPLDDLEYINETLGVNWLGMGVIDAGASEPERFGLPIEAYVTSSLVWYNPKLFDAYGYSVPTTYDEFRSLLQQIRGNESGLAPVAINQSSLANVFVDILSHTQSIDAVQTLFSMDGSFEAQPVLDALKEFQDVASNYFQVYSDGDARRAPFGENPQAFMTISGSSTDLVIQDLVNDLGSYGDQYAFFPLPTSDGSTGIVEGAASFMSAFQDSSGGKQILNYLASSEGAAAWAQATNTLSPNPAVNGYENRPALNDINNLVNSSSGDPNLILTPSTAFGDAVGSLNQELAGLQNGSSSPEGAAANMQGAYSSASRRYCVMQCKKYGKPCWCWVPC